MASLSTPPSTATMANNEEITSLTQSIHAIIPITPASQIRERLQLLSTWFGSISAAHSALTTSSTTPTVLEIGCGQGDMTVTLAGLLSYTLDADSPAKGEILAVDPAPLDYGSPITLGEAQAQISATKLGGQIRWMQAESMDAIRGLKDEGKVPAYVVLAHSLFYLPSEDYLRDLLAALRELAAGEGTKVLLAEWGMRASQPAAEAHVHAVKVQKKQAIPDGNIRTLFYPEDLKRIAGEAGWEVDREGWVVPDEDMDDGCWEVATARTVEKNGWRDEGKEMEEMEKAVSERVRCMDVWCGVLSC